MSSAAWLVQRVRVIVDPTLRRRALVTILTTSDPAVVVLAADDLVRTAVGRDDPELSGALAALISACADLAYDTRARLYALARQRQAIELAILAQGLRPLQPCAAEVDRRGEREVGLERCAWPKRPDRVARRNDACTDTKSNALRLDVLRHRNGH